MKIKTETIPIPRQEISEAQFILFIKDFKKYEKQQAFHTTMNAMLELYFEWRQTNRTSLKLRITMLFFELKRLDKKFTGQITF